MEKGREQRYDSAEAFLEDLEDLTGFVGAGRKTTRKKVPSVDGSTRPGSRAGGGGKLGRIAGGLVLLAMVGYGGYAIYTGLTGTGNGNDGGTVTDARTTRVESLLRQADEAIGERRFFSPEGQSAIDFLEEARRVDPTNADARARLSGLVSGAEQAAESLWEEGRVEEARRIVSPALPFGSRPALPAGAHGRCPEPGGSDRQRVGSSVGRDHRDPCACRAPGLRR